MNNTVSSWRDGVSRSLGGMEKGIENIEKKLDTMCKKQTNHENRIDKLEIIESNRSAVQKKMTALMAFIVAVVSVLSNIAWNIFH